MRTTDRRDNMNPIVSIAIALLLSDKSIAGLMIRSCEMARSICATRTMCWDAYRDFNNSCKNETRGLTSGCSLRCQSAIVSLSTVVEGNEYLNCKCENDNELTCELLQSRIGQCLADERVKSLIGGTIYYGNDLSGDQISRLCYNQALVCKTDPLCLDWYQSFRYLCRNALRGEFCNPKCKKSIKALGKQNISFQLDDCDCGQNYCDLCAYERSNLIKLCVSRDTQHSVEDKHLCDKQNSQRVTAKREDNHLVTTNNYDLLEFEIFLLILCLIMSFL